MAMMVYSPLNRELRLCPKMTVNEWMDVQYSTERSSQYNIIIIHSHVHNIYMYNVPTMYVMFYVLVVVMTCVKALGYTASFIIIISGFWHTCIRFDNLPIKYTYVVYYFLRISNIGNKSETTSDHRTII